MKEAHQTMNLPAPSQDLDLLGENIEQEEILQENEEVLDDKMVEIDPNMQDNEVVMIENEDVQVMPIVEATKS